MKIHTLFLILILLIIGACKGQNSMIDKAVVSEFDINKYLGTWYEIARYNHSFERGLVGVTATYSFRKDGKIQVVNAGYKESLKGKRSEAIGKAKIPDPKHPAKLKVSFFLFFYADYYVLELDPDYKWAVVGSKSDKYLWILSRTPKIDSTVYNDLLSKIKSRGYNIHKLISVEQADL